MPLTPNALFIALALSGSTALTTSANAAQYAEMRADYRPAFERFIRDEGALYGLYLTPSKQAYLLRNDLKTGRPANQPLTGPALQKLMEFVGKIPSGQTELRMAQALKLYLDGRESSDKTFETTLFSGAKKEALTPLGKSLLMDILTAEDGKLYAGETDSLWERLSKKFGRKGKGANGRVTPPAVKLPSLLSLDQAGLDTFYDNTKYAVDRERNVVRVLVAANQNLASDRFSAPQTAAEVRRIYNEAGLDAKLFNAHGAKVVRAVDNLVTVEVPLPEAAGLGLALQQEGIMSRPARVFRSAAAEIAAGPAILGPVAGFLPFPTADAVKPQNLDASKMLGLEGLWKNGMTGKGSVVGIIDSGLDPNHPDFKGRVLEYIDMTGEGQKDAFGHGTHVAGSVGGSGSASDGKYKGAAPDTKFVIFKVFDKDGNTTEDTILAAMKKAASLPADKRPNVINMSLGGPGDPDQDPIARLANRLMLKDNIMVVAAAGNSGPTNGTVGTPGSAQYILTVTGVNKQGEFPFFSSRGPINRADGSPYSKPDLSAVAGDVNLGALGAPGIQLLDASTSLGTSAGGTPGTAIKSCVYAPGGVISDRSSEDPDPECAVPGNPNYRYMSGTSMAAPMAAGAAADVIGYINSKGASYSATDVKALMMETAHDMKKASEMQGAGLLDGERLASTVIARVSAGVPVGNIAYMLSVRMTSDQKKDLAAQTRFRATPLGIVDTKNGRMIKTDEELFWMIHEIKGPMAIAYRKETPRIKENDTHA